MAIEKTLARPTSQRGQDMQCTRQFPTRDSGRQSRALRRIAASLFSNSDAVFPVA
jgi:hypothetical protein